MADASTSAVIDVWKTSYAGYPATVTNTITAAAKPTLNSATIATGSCATWSGSVVANDNFGFNMDSNTAAKWMQLTITYTR